MNELLKKIRLKDASAFTHSGKFHADDVFSSALLLYLNPEITGHKKKSCLPHEDRSLYRI